MNKLIKKKIIQSVNFVLYCLIFFYSFALHLLHWPELYQETSKLMLIVSIMFSNGMPISVSEQNQAYVSSKWIKDDSFLLFYLLFCNHLKTSRYECVITI